MEVCIVTHSLRWAASRHYGGQTVHTNHHPYRFNGLLQDITVRPCTHTTILTGSMGCFKTLWQSDREHKPASLQVQWAAFRHHSQTVHTNHHLYRFTERCFKGKKWNGNCRLAKGNVRHPPSKTFVDVLSWTCRSLGKFVRDGLERV